MVSIDASFLEGASSLSDAFAKLGFGVREERARHVRAVLQCLARAPDILRSEENGRHDHHVLLVLRDGGVDGGQLFVQIRYSSVPFCVSTRRPHVHIGHEVMRRLDQQNPEVPKEVDGESGHDGVFDDDQNARAAGEHHLLELRGNNVRLEVAVQHEYHGTGSGRREKNLPGPSFLKMGDKEDSRGTGGEKIERKEKREHGNEGHVHVVDRGKVVFRPAHRVGDNSVLVVQVAVGVDDIEWRLAANAESCG